MVKLASSNRNQNHSVNLLEEIAQRAKVKEGKELVRKILREIYRTGSIGSKSLARKLYLPIPSIAAVRKELEKEGIIDRNNKGAVLTENGLDFVTKHLFISSIGNYTCKSCDGTTIDLPENIDIIFEKMREFTSRRPIARTDIDQAYGKPITAIKRAYLMLENDDVEGREIALLGDDDFTSLAIALLKVRTKITVFDIDNRLLEIIKTVAQENNFDITCIQHDLRLPPPDFLQNKFDTVFTDPPYTISGLNLFLSRSLQVLKKEQNKKLYLAFAHRAPNDLLELQKVISAHGLAIQQILPGFNLYEGAEMHGNTTFLSILTSTDSSKILYPAHYSDDIYTGELNPTIRIYQCANGHEIRVGATEEISSIEVLKITGCPICLSKVSFTRLQTMKK
ncbi:MAG: bis-aminopropyl spermidine synthase family protein [Candidatus Heimdallarchaeota archaeon]|nr:bis-aminopropyl spermidine synthase family protein [Candidatus Heimdallarchaeota archaeon]